MVCSRITDYTQEIGVNFVRGRVAEVNPLGDKLQVRYEDTLLSDIGEAEFDMVVLCPSLIPSKGSRELADQLGVPVGGDGFITPDEACALAATGLDGIAFDVVGDAGTVRRVYGINANRG